MKLKLIAYVCFLNQFPTATFPLGIERHSRMEVTKSFSKLAISEGLKEVEARFPSSSRLQEP